MSHMKGISDDSSITVIYNEQQGDVQTSPPPVAKTLSADLDIHGVLVSKADPKKTELPGKPPNHLNEQELEDEEHGELDLVAILLRRVGHEDLIDIIFREIAFLSNVGGCSHHRYRTPEYVPKVKKIIEKLTRGYRLDEIICEEKDLVFFRQLLEHVLDSEIISSSLDAKNVNASRPDAVLEALTAAPCHSRANANLPAPISEENP